MGFLERITLVHHFFHVVHMTLGVMLGVLAHGAGLYLVVLFSMMFFGVVLASSVVTHYIYIIEKIL